MFKIATWNINSVRLRLPLLLGLLRDKGPDLVCLQETKTPDEFFPRADIAAAGYPYIHIHGMKSYNGVAILSRHPFSESFIHHRVERKDCRHIAVKFPQFELHNLYIPAGGDIPDPALNDKFDHKLKFVDEMAGWFKKNYKANDNLIAAGDFNIAPLEHDVWSHKQLLDVVSHTPVETGKLDSMYKSLDWCDAVRHFVPESEKCYTWWSYRNRDWKKSNRGRRLDHIWTTRPLLPRLKSHQIIMEARDWIQPSDHVPVMIEMNA